MTAPVYDLQAGERPLLISIPHDGRAIPEEIADRMTPEGRSNMDADWHVRELYGFAGELGASMLAANYSRYVVDLNRPADGEALYPGRDETGLCPLTTFDRQPIYRPGEGPTPAEIEKRIETYWAPYHQALAKELDRLRETHGFAVLWEAHSIRSRVPRFFAGRLPDFNFGSNDGRTCPPDATAELLEMAEAEGFTAVADGRFKGGYITRTYARPHQRVFAMQLELSQATYLDEPGIEYRPERAAKARDLIRKLLSTLSATLADCG